MSKITVNSRVSSITIHPLVNVSINIDPLGIETLEMNKSSFLWNGGDGKFHCIFFEIEKPFKAHRASLSNYEKRAQFFM
jgi:hypothetical protein